MSNTVILIKSHDLSWDLKVWYNGKIIITIGTFWEGCCIEIQSIILDCISALSARDSKAHIQLFEFFVFKQRKCRCTIRSSFTRSFQKNSSFFGGFENPFWIEKKNDQKSNIQYVEKDSFEFKFPFVKNNTNNNQLNKPKHKVGGEEESSPIESKGAAIFFPQITQIYENE